ncbi:hypothetical protein Echvi_0451 [Echinicola vietnamensis DSM 17526]|uniref:Right handed beta helix domain-containing protein n=2 Tax=Echinicola TaxID=390846 RepID=L0FTW2_ECHVK|nr:hypothetical protein Echvi_0451 [Echinicola vietnamensis DSM 17526]
MMKMQYLSEAKIICALVMGLFLVLTACSDSEDEQPQEEILPPIVLACDYFNEDRVLENDPRRPVDYVIECWANVQGALRINPGVVVAFEKDAGLYVNLDNNLFEVVGRQEEPVVFTGTVQQKGHWRGLFFTEAHNLNNTIEHTVIEYAGSQNLTSSSPVYEGSLALRGVSGTPPQALSLSHVEIRNGGSVGLDFHGVKTNATVSASNLVITGNEGVPVKVSAEMAHIFDNTSSYAGNASDFLNITSSNYEIEEKTVTWQQLDVPYLVDSRVQITTNGHLTIEAGTELQFRSEAYLQVSSGWATDAPSLKIQGTESDPVHLKAHNGTDWGGIYYGFTEEDNVIEHAVIEHAKGDFPVGNIQNTGAVYMHADPMLTVTNTTFQDLPNYAFFAYTGASSSQPELPNLNRSSNTYINVAKGEAGLGYLGWNNKP